MSVVLVKQFAAVPGLTFLMDFTLSVVLVKQLAAVLGLTFFMDLYSSDERTNPEPSSYGLGAVTDSGPS